MFSENTARSLGFETLNQIRTEKRRKDIHLLECNEKQMLGGRVTFSVTHLLCVNVISSQESIQELSLPNAKIISARKAGLLPL